jgi:hypothetical protein
MSARRERHWAGKHFGSVRIAQKDQKSIRINPTRNSRLREPFEVLHIDRLHGQCSWSAPTFTPAFRHIPSLRCQEIHARVPRRNGCSQHGCIFLGVFRIGGANRDRTDDLKLAKLALSQLSYGPKSMRRIAHQRKAIHRRPNTRSWWAWEDLNFRPHAYQARALTN